MNTVNSDHIYFKKIGFTDRYLIFPKNIITAVFLIISLIFLTANISRAQLYKIKFKKHSTKVMTNFNPYSDGFRFANQFTNVFIPAVNWKTAGLCGGMCYAALDYYNAHKHIPIQTYMPANRKKLYNYLYNREVKSIEKNVDRWAKVIVNFGNRNNELFQNGLSNQLKKLKSFIDRGIPVVIDLSGGGGGKHQMVAIGYDMGRYKGDLGKYKSDVKIYLYDPNAPRKIEILTPNLTDKLYHETETNEKWRTYFVDDRYVKKTPPNISNPLNEINGKIREMVLTFRNGSDGLRGGHANVDLKIYLMDGSHQFYPNINKSARWVGLKVKDPFDYPIQNASVRLNRPIPQSEINKLVLTATSKPGPGSDKWDLKSLNVNIVKNDTIIEIQKAGPKRFTPTDNRLEVPISQVIVSNGQVNKLKFIILTGTDDLRGGRDNLNINTHFIGGRTQREPNVNKGEHWKNNTRHVVTIRLDRPIKPNKIKSITLVTTFRGGIGGDNWNMKSVKVEAIGKNVDELLTSHGFKRFTGKKKTLNLVVGPTDLKN